MIAYDIIYDIICILQTPNPHCMLCSSLAAANLPPAQRSDAGDGGNDPDREMDPDEARDYADQGPLPDRDMEEDNQILATLLQRIPSCKTASDIEQLMQDIPVQPPVVVLVATIECGCSQYLNPKP